MIRKFLLRLLDSPPTKSSNDTSAQQLIARQLEWWRVHSKGLLPDNTTWPVTPTEKDLIYLNEYLLQTLRTRVSAPVYELSSLRARLEARSHFFDELSKSYVHLLKEVVRSSGLALGDLPPEESVRLHTKHAVQASEQLRYLREALLHLLSVDQDRPITPTDIEKLRALAVLLSDLRAVQK